MPSHLILLLPLLQALTPPLSPPPPTVIASALAAHAMKREENSPLGYHILFLHFRLEGAAAWEWQPTPPKFRWALDCHIPFCHLI